jgi:GNAT superfamily N-acetyltransferase
MRLKLSFTNDPRALPGVRAFVAGTLEEMALPVEGRQPLGEFILAAAEAAVREAYPAGESGLIKLAIRESHGRVEVRVRDFGLPQDVKQLERKLRENGVSAATLFASVPADALDEVHWLGFGPRGKALQIIKWLPAAHVADLNENAASAKQGESEVPLAPPQEYDVRRMRPDEAVQVSQLMYRTYGNTYFNKDVYYPERVAALNVRGEVLSVVAVGADGHVAGHCALERNLDGPVAEIGQAAVDPAHRGRGLLDRMKAALEGEARSLGLLGYYTDAVAVHKLTQQSNAHHGGRVCGIDLAVSPKSEAFRQIAGTQPQRVSCVLYFHWLTEPQARKACVLMRHRKIVGAIYENVGCRAEFGDGEPPRADHGTLTVKFEKGSALGTIRVESIGGDSENHARHALRQLVEHSRAKVVDIELPISDPGTPGLCEAMEADGVAFTGIGPHFSPRGDVLKLAYLLKPLEREPIKTVEPIAEQLVEYALAEQVRVRASL